MIRAFQKGEVKTPYARMFPSKAKEAELRDSLRAQGQQEPGVVSALGNVLAGMTRAKLLFEMGQPFRAVVRDDVDTEAKELAFVAASDKTSSRHPSDKARAISAYLRVTGKTQKEVAKEWGMTEPALSRLLAPLDMAAPIREAFEAGRVTLEHVVALKKARDEARQVELLGEALAGRSAREIAKMARPKRGKAERTATYRFGRAVLSVPVDVDVDEFDAAVVEFRNRVVEASRKRPKGKQKLVEVLGP